MSLLNISEEKRRLLKIRLEDIIQTSTIEGEPPYTPLELCEEIIEKVIEHGGKLTENVLVVANLEFVVVIKHYLLSQGCDIINLWFSSPCPIKRQVAEGLGAKAIDSILVAGVDVKFDVIVGNPPYQPPIQRKDGPRNGSGSGSSIWQKFVEKSIYHLQDDGLMAYIHPNTWRFTFLKEKDKLASVRELLDGKLIWLMINVDNFFQIGNSIEIDAYIYQKNKNDSLTLVKNSNNGFELKCDLSKIKIPTQFSKETISITQKIFSDNTPKITIEITPRKFASNAAFIQNTEDNLHKFEFLNTSAQYRKGKSLWSSIPHPHQTKLKIIFCDSGDESFIFDRDGKYGCCHHTHCILVNSIDEGEALLKFLTSKMVKNFLQFYRKSGSMYAPTGAITYLPKITSMLSEQEILDIFNNNDD